MHGRLRQSSVMRRSMKTPKRRWSVSSRKSLISWSRAEQLLVEDLQVRQLWLMKWRLKWRSKRSCYCNSRKKKTSSLKNLKSNKRQWAVRSTRRKSWGTKCISRISTRTPKCLVWLHEHLDMVIQSLESPQKIRSLTFQSVELVLLISIASSSMTKS